MTGTCGWGTCEEGKRCSLLRAETDRQRRGGVFTEAEPELHTQSTTCSFPTLLFAACPHTLELTGG